MNAKRGDRFIDPFTKKSYDVTELVMDGSYAILKEVDGNHEILLSQEELKKWRIEEGE
jgi:lipocalin